MAWNFFSLREKERKLIFFSRTFPHYKETSHSLTYLFVVDWEENCSLLIFPHKIEKRADFDSFFPYNTRKEAVINSFFPLEDKEFFPTISRKESHGWLIIPSNREKEAMFVCFFFHTK